MLIHDGDTYLWTGSLADLNCFVEDSAENFLTQKFESLVNKSKGNKADSKNGTDGAIVSDGDTVYPDVLEVCKCSCSVDLEGLKLEITILESRLFAAISKNELELDIDLLRVKQEESEATIRRQDDINYNVDKDKEPGSSVYKVKSIDKATAFHASEQSNKSNLSSVNTELLNTTHDNILARHNNNGQCNADDLNNNQIDLAIDDAVFSPKQQNENNTHKGINLNLQSESQQSTSIEGNKPRYDLSPKTSHDNNLIRHNDNSQCNADDLKNNHIDLTNDDAVFFPKQQNKNNTHKGLNSNLQSESQQSINSE
ncbi:Hypothetical predicted protein [Paramuricea clavata]|uniref:Uncharacterized protein n=1 Tax=Paramuricea clavata TaxID=317549 RepID=A0A6S7IIW0_PARCT|nr:Hypothetical predicted protein [Paramuricea clavata]